ncbi:hypothetical protein VTK73DRAFT_5689 [Phialemonium thermophilum]|uniref:Uncharacterized protein n=1 Tax=Phialemonium thermophilum TaxID=223376 RepID=A0ABR3WLY3_9PEZI
MTCSYCRCLARSFSGYTTLKQMVQLMSLLQLGNSAFFDVLRESFIPEPAMPYPPSIALLEPDRAAGHCWDAFLLTHVLTNLLQTLLTTDSSGSFPAPPFPMLCLVLVTSTPSFPGVLHQDDPVIRKGGFRALPGIDTSGFLVCSFVSFAACKPQLWNLRGGSLWRAASYLAPISLGCPWLPLFCPCQPLTTQSRSKCNFDFPPPHSPL